VKDVSDVRTGYFGNEQSKYKVKTYSINRQKFV